MLPDVRIWRNIFVCGNHTQHVLHHMTSPLVSVLGVPPLHLYYFSIIPVSCSDGQKVCVHQPGRKNTEPQTEGAQNSPDNWKPDPIWSGGKWHCQWPCHWLEKCQGGWLAPPGSNMPSWTGSRKTFSQCTTNWLPKLVLEHCLWASTPLNILSPAHFPIFTFIVFFLFTDIFINSSHLDLSNSSLV